MKEENTWFTSPELHGHPGPRLFVGRSRWPWPPPHGVAMWEGWAGPWPGHSPYRQAALVGQQPQRGGQGLGHRQAPLPGVSRWPAGLWVQAPQASPPPRVLSHDPSWVPPWTPSGWQGPSQAQPRPKSRHSPVCCLDDQKKVSDHPVSRSALPQPSLASTCPGIMTRGASGPTLRWHLPDAALFPGPACAAPSGPGVGTAAHQAQRPLSSPSLLSSEPLSGNPRLHPG